MQAKQFPVHHFGVENFVVFLEASDGSHLWEQAKTVVPASQGLKARAAWAAPTAYLLLTCVSA
jgi:hypothetical protein